MGRINKIRRNIWITRYCNVRALVGLIFLVGVVLFTRLYKLDQDLPAWGIINYQPMDEGQYATMALNKINYGSFRPDMKDPGVEFRTEAHVRNDLVGNLLIYLGLKCFGDNYYGFRMASVIVALTIHILFVLILRKLRNRYGKIEYKCKDNIVTAAFFLLFTIDFSFLMAGRVVETTIFRLLFLVLQLYFFVIFESSRVYTDKIRFFLLGFLSTLSVFCVYITNIFMVVSGVVIIILIGRTKKTSVLNMMAFYVAGCGIAYVISDLYYYFFWGESCLVNAMNILAAFSGTDGYTGGKISSLGKLFMSFLSANYNLYNLGILFLFMIVLPVMVKKMKDDEAIAYMLIIFFCFGFQLIITEDYIVRKYILMVPVVLFVLYIYFIDKRDLAICFSEKRCGVYALYIVVCMCILVAIIMYRLFYIDNGTNRDFNFVDKVILSIQLCLVEIFAGRTLRSVVSEKSYQMKYGWFIVLLFSSFFTNIYLDARYVIFNNTYSEKCIMMELGKVVGKEFVYGIFSPAYTLYNDIKPVVNTYEVLGRQIGEEKTTYYLDYSGFDFPAQIMEASGREWWESMTFDRDFSTFGVKKSISIYRTSDFGKVTHKKNEELMEGN